MTEVQHRPASSGSASTAQSNVTIRPYRPADHSACRSLWAELVEHRNSLYSNRPLEHDPGAGFEEYLTQLNLSGMWVADAGEDGVVGFIGVMIEGRTGEVDPIVVTAARRGRGIGRAMLAKVVDEARRRGLTELSVSPPTRDRSALRALHNAGFATVASVTVSYDLRGRPGGSGGSADRSTLDLFDLDFHV
jgi:GNAT superfamily N-acetyltransferase